MEIKKRSVFVIAGNNIALDLSPISNPHGQIEYSADLNSWGGGNLQLRRFRTPPPILELDVGILGRARWTYLRVKIRREAHFWHRESRESLFSY